MAELDPLPFAEVGRQLGRFLADVREMLALRWALARLELRDAAASLRRLAVALAVTAVLTTAGLSVLAVAWAESLDRHLGLSREAWLTVFGLGLLGLGLLLGSLAWWTFRRRFTAMEETLEEIREDFVWLSEWTGQAPSETDDSRR
jgi:protein-S-isoprenylcysteine O-methyltransferase Ste14